MMKVYFHAFPKNYYPKISTTLIAVFEKLTSDGIIPEKRMGTPDDIGKIVAALATGQMPYCTGHLIAPDGGMEIWRL
jgi:3-oxoacyl-[acyl-carrier protein] reductase